MSRGRFGVLLALLAALVTAAAFTGVTAGLGNDPSTPPGVTGGGTTSTTVALLTTTSTSAPETTATSAPDGRLTTPALVVVVTSSTAKRDANATLAALADRGYAAGVLHSDDYSSLERGFWVAYTGPYPSAAAAEAGKAKLIGDGYRAAYTRCVGTTAECA